MIYSTTFISLHVEASFIIINAYKLGKSALFSMFRLSKCSLSSKRGHEWTFIVINTCKVDEYLSLKLRLNWNNIRLS